MSVSKLEGNHWQGLKGPYNLAPFVLGKAGGGVAGAGEGESWEGEKEGSQATNIKWAAAESGEQER